MNTSAINAIFMDYSLQVRYNIGMLETITRQTLDIRTEPEPECESPKATVKVSIPGAKGFTLDGMELEVEIETFERFTQQAHKPGFDTEVRIIDTVIIPANAGIPDELTFENWNIRRHNSAVMVLKRHSYALLVRRDEETGENLYNLVLTVAQRSKTDKSIAYTPSLEDFHSSPLHTR
jgi:hypothetical protein